MVLTLPGRTPSIQPITPTTPTGPVPFDTAGPSAADILTRGNPNVQSTVPAFVEFPEHYGVSQEELFEMGNVDPLIATSAPTLAQLNDPIKMVEWHKNEKQKFAKRETAQAVTNAAIDFVRQTNPDLIKQWEEQGEIGITESLIENPVTKIPFAGSLVKAAQDLDVISTMKRLQSDNYKDFTPSAPIGMGGSTGPRAITAEEKRERDMDTLGLYLTNQAEMSIRGQSVGGKISSGLSQAPAFMIEFATTGGGANIAKEAMKRTIAKTTEKVLGKAVSKGLGTVGGVATGAAVRTLVNPQRVASESTQAFLESSEVDLTEDGFKISQNTTPTKALLKGTASTFIEMFSESAGKDIISKLIPNKVRETFQKAFKLRNPGKKVESLWTKGGFDGFIEEMGEEELGEIMRVGFGVDSIEQYKQSKTLENYLVKGGVIGLTGGAGKFASKVADVVLPEPKRTLAQSEEVLAESLESAPVELVLKEDGRADQEATEVNLPPVPKGKIRLFRAENPTVAFEDIFPKDSLKDFAPNRDGTFWTNQLDDARFIGEKYGPESTIKYTDVPLEDAANFKDNGNDIEFILSKDIFKEGSKPRKNEVTSETPKKDIPTEAPKLSLAEAKKAQPVKEVPQVVEEVVAEKERPAVEESKRKTRPTRSDMKKITDQKSIVSGRPVRGAVQKSIKPKTVKRQVRETTGQVDLQAKKEISEKSLVKLKFSSEQKGSLKGFRAAKLETKANLKDAKAFVQKNLPLEVRGKALSALKDATDQKGLDKVIATVNKLQDEFEHREAKAALVKALKKVTGRKAGKLSQESRRQVDRIRKDFTLKSTPKKVADDLRARLEEIKDDPLLFDDHTIKSVLDKLEGAELATIGDLPTKRLKELTFTIETIKKLDKLQRDLMFGNMALERDEFKGKIIKSLEGQAPLKRKTRQGEPEKNILSEIWDRSLGPVESAQRIDDATGGAFKTIFYDNPKKQEDKYHSVNHEGKDHLIKVLEEAGVPWGSKDLQNWSKVTSKKGDTIVKTMKLESGQTLTLSPDELMAFSLMSKDAYHQKKFINNNLVYSGFDITGPRIEITRKDIENVLGLMTKQEKAVAKGVGEWYKNQGTALVEGTLNILGQSRDLRPDYYPITTSQNKTQEYKSITPEAFMSDFAQSSFLQETVQHSKPIVIRGLFEQFFEHVDQSAKARHLMMPVRNMMSIMGDPDIKTAITRVSGKQAIDYWNNRTKAIVRMGPNRSTPTDKGYNKFLRRFGTHALGWNPSPILKQAAGLWPASSILGPKVLVNYAKALKNPIKIPKEFMSGSPTLRNRYEMHGSHLATQNLEDVQPLLGKQSVIDNSTEGLQLADKAVVSAIYLTIKDKIKKLNKNIKEKDLIRRAARETELVVAKTQNITSVLDMSGIAIDSKSSTILKSTTMFMSNAERMQNMIRQSWWELKKSDKSKQDIAKYINTNLAVMIGNAGSSVVVNKLNKIALLGALALVTGSDDELDKALSPEEFYQSIPKDIIMENFSSFYFIGKAAKMVDDAFSGKYWWRTDLLGPGVQVAVLGVETALNTAKIMEEGFGSTKGNESAMKALFQAGQIAFTFRGIPAYPLRVTKKGMTQLLKDTKSGSSRTKRRRNRTRPQTRRRRRRRS